MTDVLIRNLSVARKPRSLQTCAECEEPCYPGLARYRAQHRHDYTTERDSFFHPQCLPKWMARFIREHREQLKKEGIK